MARLTTAVFFSLLASVALAAPKLKHQHHHHRGTGTGTGYPIPTGSGSPYSISNTTWYGPTGTGFPSIPVVFSTVYVSPLPVSEAPVPASSVVAAKVVAPNSVVPCGLPPATVTASNTVTVTVAGSSAAGAASSSVVSVLSGPPYSIGNATTWGPTGPTGSNGPTAYPTWTAPLVIPPAYSSSSAAALPASPSSSSSSAAAYTPPAYTPPAPASSASSAAAYTPPAVSSTTTTSPSSSSVAAYTPPASTFTTSTAILPASSPPPARPVAPATTSTAATPASPPSGAKRGIVYNTATLCAPFASSTAISWGYNWAASAGGLASSLNYIPMLWGLKDGLQDSFVADATAALAAAPAGEKFILGFNEPDEQAQYGGADLDPASAAGNWTQYIQTPFAGAGVRFGSPAVTNANSTAPLMGAPWLTQFLAACAGCTVDFVVAHWYGWAGGSAAEQAAAFQAYVLAFHAQFARPVWVTEFSALPLTDQATNAAFMALVLPWLDAQPASVVGRYSYFMVTDGELLSGTSLSQMGEAYLSG
ncbi:hypothetical protein MMC15_001789 [Xylographa vitiligo]|nr:hypothetical protein [Xylographa vitiligo]